MLELSIVSDDPSNPASAAVCPRLKLSPFDSLMSDLSSTVLNISGLDIDLENLDDSASFFETSSFKWAKCKFDIRLSKVDLFSA